MVRQSKSSKIAINWWQLCRAPDKKVVSFTPIGFLCVKLIEKIMIIKYNLMHGSYKCYWQELKSLGYFSLVAQNLKKSLMSRKFYLSISSLLWRHRDVLRRVPAARDGLDFVVGVLERHSVTRCAGWARSSWIGWVLWDVSIDFLDPKLSSLSLLCPCRARLSFLRKSRNAAPPV